MSREINPFGLRMPASLRERVEAACKASGRSLNAEIVYRLSESIDSEGTLKKTAASVRIGGIATKGLADEFVVVIGVLNEVAAKLQQTSDTLNADRTLIRKMATLAAQLGEPGSQARQNALQRDLKALGDAYHEYGNADDPPKAPLTPAKKR